MMQNEVYLRAGNVEKATTLDGGNLLTKKEACNNAQAWPAARHDSRNSHSPTLGLRCCGLTGIYVRRPCCPCFSLGV
jgi:hypothetical protein